MNLRFAPHAQRRMARDVITAAEVADALAHPTHPPRAVRRGRLLARRVHAHSVLSVLYVEQPQGPLVVSCWRALR